MYCRLLFVFFILLTTELGFADSDNWDCKEEQGAEWSCGDLDVSDKTAKPILAKSNDKAKKPAISAKKTVISTKPPKVTKKNPGWDCYTGDTDEKWNCSLKGTDPKGNTRTINDKEDSFNLFPDAFNFNQEQNFKTLQSQLAYDPWKNCRTSSRGKYTYIQEKDDRDTEPMNVTADYTEVFDKEVTGFFGNVEITRADQKVLSDRASFDTVSETMDAQGQVLYTENEMALFSDTVMLNLQTNEARLRNAIFISPSGPIRGHANVVYRDSNVLSRYTDTAFTSCAPGNQDWVMHAERLKMNKQTGKGAAKHAWLEFKGVPFLYSPYISFPMDDRRMTGLLSPHFGGLNGENGFDLTLPYYWNIAPNYDFVVRPRYMSKRGGMIGGEFRYLTEMTNGLVGVEYMPYDLLKDEQRYSATFKNRTVFTPYLNSHIDLNYVSDDEYFDELNNALGIASDRYLQSQANVNYRREGVLFKTHFESYQTIDKTVLDSAKPYQKLPQVILNLDHSFDDWPLDIALQNEYVNFYRDGRVSGHRLNLKPSIAIPFKTAGSFITPKISLQHTQYFLNNQNEGVENNISRTLPIMSVDSGLIFERDYKSKSSAYMHTIEPRLFYLYIPNKDQDDIPKFDTSFYDYSYSSLFRENRFSGVDRVQDANQISMAVTSRLIDSKTGQERLKLSVGEILHFRDREVSLAKTTPTETNDFSDLIAELSGKITQNLSFTTGIHWDPYESDISRGHAKLTYRDQSERILNVGYRYRRDEIGGVVTGIKGINRTDVSFRWPIMDHWYGVGRWQYSIKYHSTPESFLGLEKENCCWRFRFIWRRYSRTLLDDTSTVLELEDNEMDEGFFIQLELKGLTSFDYGGKADKFLEENLSGYQSPE